MRSVKDKNRDPRVRVCRFGWSATGMLLQSLLLHARAAPPCAAPVMSAGRAPAKAEVRSERWTAGSQSERAVRIEVMRPALDALPGSGGRPVAADKVGHCGVAVLNVDDTGFHTDCPTTRPRAMVTGTVFVKPRFRRQGVAQRLVREAETHARLWGFSELLLPVDPNNAAAHRLYEKLGYVKIKGSGGQAKQVTLKRNLWAPNLHTVRRARLHPSGCHHAPKSGNPLHLAIVPSYHLSLLLIRRTGTLYAKSAHGSTVKTTSLGRLAARVAMIERERES
jgi:GNAT superfamily N-acetyltransferase